MTRQELYNKENMIEEHRDSNYHAGISTRGSKQRAAHVDIKDVLYLQTKCMSFIKFISTYRRVRFWPDPIPSFG